MMISYTLRIHRRILYKSQGRNSTNFMVITNSMILVLVLSLQFYRSLLIHGIIALPRDLYLGSFTITRRISLGYRNAPYFDQRYRCQTQ